MAQFDLWIADFDRPNPRARQSRRELIHQDLHFRKFRHGSLETAALPFETECPGGDSNPHGDLTHLRILSPMRLPFRHPGVRQRAA